MIRVFDGHSDVFEDVYEKRKRGMRNVLMQVHAPKWERGNCKSGFCPIWIDPFCDVYSISVDQQFEEIMLEMKNELLDNSCAEPVINFEQYNDALNAGKHAMILGAEGLSFLHGDYGRIKQLYDRKLRIFSLTWNEDNEFAQGASSMSGMGLTDKGIEAVKEIEGLGAILDLAHSSKKTFFDAMKIISRPFVVSHGNVEAVLPHSRNFNDEQLKLIRDTDSVVGISAFPLHICSSKEGHTLESYCDCIKYVADKIGIDHVGLGFDFVDFLDDFGSDESISFSLENLEGIDKAQNVYLQLKNDGMSDEELEKVFHLNFERIIKTISES